MGGEPEQSFERNVPMEAAIVAKDEFVEIGVDVFSAQPVICGLVAAMLASRYFKGIRRKRLPIFMLGADHAFQDPMGRWIATGTLAE